MHNMTDSSRHETVLIGYGQIAQAQHAPIILARSEHFSLNAIVDPCLNADKESLPAPLYETLADAIKSVALDTAVIACPPNVAGDYAQEALTAGLNVFMEKPPGLDHERLKVLESLAEERRVTFFTGYHSVFCPKIKQAKRWIQTYGPPKEVRITWKESAAKWHPGQHWITKYFGVLDILFNPLSILEELLGSEIEVSCSTLVIPSNWKSPIAGSTILKCRECQIVADYAWNHEDEDIWTIAMMGAKGEDTLELHNGGARMLVNGVDITTEKESDDILRPEYEALYNRFHSLVIRGESEVRPAPLRLINKILEQSKIEIGKEYHI